MKLLGGYGHNCICGTADRFSQQPGCDDGTGTTDSVGNVSFSYTPQGLAPGYYRLVATTNAPGLSSSIGFGVQ